MSTTVNLSISNIEELVFVLDNDFDNFKITFDQIVAQIIKNQQHLSSFITYVNIQLSNASTRNKGIIILYSLIKLCPTEVVSEHAIAWINNSLKYCENEKQVNVTSFKIINAILELCSKTPELNKSIISNILEKIIDEIKSIPSDSPNATIGLQCLLTCLQIYAGSCGPRKIPLNKYLISYVNLPPTSYGVRLAGKCLMSLQQVGGGGVEGINYYNNWKKQQQRLIATMHSLMDQFFEYVTEFGDYSQDILEIIPLEIGDLSESKNYQNLTYRLVNIIVFLQEMLLGAYPVKKGVLPVIILNVITRGLAITSTTLGSHILEDKINLTTYLCMIHKNLLELLQCLILSLGTNLLPYGQIICKLLVNNVKNISNEEVFLIKTFCDLKLTAYETIRLWLTVAKSNSSINTFMEILFPVLLADITPPKIELNLTVQNGGPKSLNKKARKKLLDQKTSNFANRMQNSSIGKYIMSNSNYQINICAASLQTFQMILNYECLFIKVIFHKQLQEFVIKKLYNIQQGNISYPYNNENCQIELYKTLISLTTSHHFKIPPPLNYTILLLTNGQNSKIQQISQICSTGLINLNSFIHPYFASLQLPLDLEDLKIELKELDTNKNTIELISDDEKCDASGTNLNGHQTDNEDIVDHNVNDEHLKSSKYTISQTYGKGNIEIVSENVDIQHNLLKTDINKAKPVTCTNYQNENDIIEIRSDNENVDENKDPSLQKNVLTSSNIDSSSSVQRIDKYDMIISGGNEDNVIEIGDDNDENGKQNTNNCEKAQRDESEEEIVELRVEDDEDGEKMSVDVEEICNSFVDIVN